MDSMYIYISPYIMLYIYTYMITMAIYCILMCIYIYISYPSSMGYGIIIIMAMGNMGYYNRQCLVGIELECLISLPRQPG